MTAALDASRLEQLEQLRRRIAAVPGKGEHVARRLDTEGRTVAVHAVPEPLREVLPGGGLAKGSVVAYAGATSLLLGLLAAVTADGGHAAIVGRPRLGLLAAIEMGAELRRIALVRNPGPNPVDVAAVLLDGMDLVVLGLGGAAVTPSRARAVVARARSKGATLVVADGRWDGAEVRLDAQVTGFEGLRTGRGRVRSVQLSVRVEVSPLLIGPLTAPARRPLTEPATATLPSSATASDRPLAWSVAPRLRA